MRSKVVTVDHQRRVVSLTYINKMWNESVKHMKACRATEDGFEEVDYTFEDYLRSWREHDYTVLPV